MSRPPARLPAGALPRAWLSQHIAAAPLQDSVPGAVQTARCPSPPIPCLRPLRSKVYGELVGQGVIVPAQDVTPPEVPMDLGAAKKQGKVRWVGGCVA